MSPFEKNLRCLVTSLPFPLAFAAGLLYAENWWASAAFALIGFGVEIYCFKRWVL